jgi:hypothetical protein
MIRHQWVLIVAIAAGLVGMHHLVHAQTVHPMAMARATPTGHADPDPAGANAIEPRSTSVGASQADCCDPLNMVGHFCLAVLTTITALTVALIFAGRPSELGRLLAVLSVLAARAPPTGSVRFSQLCVLRR